MVGSRAWLTVLLLLSGSPRRAVGSRMPSAEHEDLLDRINTLSDAIKTHRLLEQLRLSNERES